MPYIYIILNNKTKPLHFIIFLFKPPSNYLNSLSFIQKIALFVHIKKMRFSLRPNFYYLTIIQNFGICLIPRPSRWNFWMDEVFAKYLFSLISLRKYGVGQLQFIRTCIRPKTQIQMKTIRIVFSLLPKVKRKNIKFCS